MRLVMNVCQRIAVIRLRPKIADGAGRNPEGRRRHQGLPSVARMAMRGTKVSAMLEVKKLEVAYGGGIKAIKGVDFYVNEASW